MDIDILPAISPLNRAWFTSGTLAVQYCDECNVLQHPPEEQCHRCGRMDLPTKELAPRGTIYSHTVVRYGASPALAERVPYAVILVALDEAPEIRVVGDFLGDVADVAIGLRVAAEWTEHEADGEIIRLPRWRAA